MSEVASDISAVRAVVVALLRPLYAPPHSTAQFLFLLLMVLFKIDEISRRF